MRRLPIYFIIDVAAKKSKQFIAIFLNTILGRMRCNPWMLETCCVSFLLHNNKSLIEKTRLTDIVSINIDDVLCSFNETQKEIANDTQGKYHYTQHEMDCLNALLKDVINVDFIHTTATIKGDWLPMIIDINNERIRMEILRTHKECIEILDELDDWNILATYVGYLLEEFHSAHECGHEPLIPFSSFKNYKNNHI